MVDKFSAAYFNEVIYWSLNCWIITSLHTAGERFRQVSKQCHRDAGMQRQRYVKASLLHMLYFLCSILTRASFFKALCSLLGGLLNVLPNQATISIGAEKLMIEQLPKEFVKVRSSDYTLHVEEEMKS